MYGDLIQFKPRLLDKLWLPAMENWGKMLGHSGKGKNLKILTLTSDRNYQEIIQFEKKGYTQRKYIIAWTYAHIKKLRLETEISPIKISGTARYESCVSMPTFDIKSEFPFDIINLDFCSQDPIDEKGRIEEEINSVEDTIRLQDANDLTKFVLLYTTLINSNSLDCLKVTQQSDNIHVSGWNGLNVSQFPIEISNPTEKIECIRILMPQMGSKYKFDSATENLTIPMNKKSKFLIYSIAALYKRS